MKTTNNEILDSVIPEERILGTTSGNKRIIDEMKMKMIIAKANLDAKKPDVDSNEDSSS